MRLANQFQGQTVKGQGYRRAGHTVSAEPGGHIACFYDSARPYRQADMHYDLNLSVRPSVCRSVLSSVTQIINTMF